MTGEFLEEVAALLPEDLNPGTADWMDVTTLLKTLLDWFKDSFFTQIDQSKCDKCGNTANLVYVGMEKPTLDEYEGT